MINLFLVTRVLDNTKKVVDEKKKNELKNWLKKLMWNMF